METKDCVVGIISAPPVTNWTDWDLLPVRAEIILFTTVSIPCRARPPLGAVAPPRG